MKLSDLPILLAIVVTALLYPILARWEEKQRIIYVSEQNRPKNGKIRFKTKS